jgi:hypothetical protein
VPSDSPVRAKLTGTWSAVPHDAEFTMNSDGSYVSTFTRGGLDYEFEGTWTVKDGVLILKLTANHSVNTKHTMRVGSSESYKIAYVDSGMLVFEGSDGIMQVWVHVDRKSKRSTIFGRSGREQPNTALEPTPTAP